MCDHSNCSHDALNDDLSDIFGGEYTPADLEHGYAVAQAEKNRVFTETCPACKGSGQFRGWSGRIVGNCFKCKGSGSRSFKTSPEARENSRQQAAKRRDAQAAAIADEVNEWGNANPAEYRWILLNAPSFEFAASMNEFLNRKGYLTEGQIAAVRRCVARNEAREEQRANRQQATGAAIDVSKIETAFATAKSNGIKRPKMVLDGIKFSCAPAHGVNAGALYVVRSGGDGAYLGKIKDGKFFKNDRECTEADEKHIIEVASDPYKSAVAYGIRTGNCCICSRELTRTDSIERGIGPICAEKFGW